MKETWLKLKTWFTNKYKEERKVLTLEERIDAVNQSMVKWKIKNTKEMNKRFEEVEDLISNNRIFQTEKVKNAIEGVSRLSENTNQLSKNMKRFDEISKEFFSYASKEEELLKRMNIIENRCIKLQQEMEDTQQKYLKAIDIQVRDAVRIMKEKANASKR